MRQSVSKNSGRFLVRNFVCQQQRALQDLTECVKLFMKFGA